MYNNIDLMQENQQPKITTQQRPKNTLEELCVLKKPKVTNYPYYPITHTLSKNGFNYVFTLDLSADNYYNLCVTPFKENKQKYQYIQLSNCYVQLDCVPRANVNFLYVLQYEDSVNGNGKSITVRFMDFIIGFYAGFLIRLKYSNTVKIQGTVSGKRQLQIIGKYNKKTDYKQGIFMRMTSTFFGSDEFYKVAVQKPVRSFECYLNSNKQKRKPNQIYNYSYLIGNRLYFATQFSPETESQILKIFEDIRWADMPMETLAKLYKTNSTVINSKRHKTLITSNSILIQWADEIACYIYTPDNELLVADNQQNRLLIFDVQNNLRIKKVYNFDLDIKKMSYFTLKFEKQISYLLIMPYDTKLFLINLTQNQIVSIIGHKSYITQAMITDSGWIITGGCDHRVGLRNLKSLKQWNSIPKSKQNIVIEGAHRYEIETSKVSRAKMGETYFLGEFNNVNSQRNNNSDYGFGNFLSFGKGSLIYAFLSFDFLVKIYRIIV